jgi:hypothetical protein
MCIKGTSTSGSLAALAETTKELCLSQAAVPELPLPVQMLKPAATRTSASDPTRIAQVLKFVAVVCFAGLISATTASAVQQRDEDRDGVLDTFVQST